MIPWAVAAGVVALVVVLAVSVAPAIAGRIVESKIKRRPVGDCDHPPACQAVIREHIPAIGGEVVYRDSVICACCGLQRAAVLRGR